MQGQLRRLPWVTAAIMALALAVWAAPAAVQRLCLYDRSALWRGEIWRLWSGHLVHFSISHLGWNLLVVGLVGAWIEYAEFRGRGWLVVVTPPVISLALLLGEPTLHQYGGLSGVATAAVVFACLSEWRRASGAQALWAVAIVIVAIKIAWEFYSERSVFTDYAAVQVRMVPLSHLAGLCVGAATAMAASARKKCELATG